MTADRVTAPDPLARARAIVAGLRLRAGESVSGETRDLLNEGARTLEAAVEVEDMGALYNAIHTLDADLNDWHKSIAALTRLRTAIRSPEDA